MQLWSNDRLTEFAIKFNSVIVVTTSHNLETMIKIDECPYRLGYEIDWHYTLSQWVVYYLANKFTVLLDSKTSIRDRIYINDWNNNRIFSISISIMYNNVSVQGSISKRLLMISIGYWLNQCY